MERTRKRCKELFPVDVSSFIDKYMVRESISKIWNGRASARS